MKKQCIVLAGVSMLFAIIIASCSQEQGNLNGDMPTERSIGTIVEPPDFPAEYRKVLGECEDLYQKMQEDPSYEVQLTKKRAELRTLEEKYGIKSMTDEEMQEDILKHSGSNSISRQTTSLDDWLTSVYGYYSNSAAYVNWDPYKYAIKYEVYQYTNTEGWKLWATLIPEAAGFVNRNSRRFVVHCVYGNSDDDYVSKEISV